MKHNLATTAFIPAMVLGQTLTCDAEEGLRCLNLDNTQDCHNYEISFYCDCGGVAYTTPIPGPSESRYEVVWFS